MSALYNEIDPYCAQWLRNLIAAGHIAPGVVDERSIEDITPDELRGYTQVHCFAGIGVWSYALRLAGWPDDRPVWTGSCPCQPFSAAGKGAGFADERHLWPAWFHLIRECRPPVVFGEQVASKAVDPWIDLVCADMESMGHAFGCEPFPSAGIGAPHIRDRSFWMADANRAGRTWLLGQGSSGVDRGHNVERPQSGSGFSRKTGGLAHATVGGRGEECAHAGGIVIGDSAQGLAAGPVHGGADHGPRPTNGFWRDADWLGCTDGKWRPVEPGTFPLAHGIANRVGRLRAYGNAINASAAEVFIRCVMECSTP